MNRDEAACALCDGSGRRFDALHQTLAQAEQPAAAEPCLACAGTGRPRAPAATIAALLQTVIEGGELGYNDGSRRMLGSWLRDTAQRFRTYGQQAADVSDLFLYGRALETGGTL